MVRNIEKQTLGIILSGVFIGGEVYTFIFLIHVLFLIIEVLDAGELVPVYGFVSVRDNAESPPRFING